MFVILPRPTSERLLAKGRELLSVDHGQPAGGRRAWPRAVLVRLVTSFATTAGEVDAFVARRADASNCRGL